MVERISLILKSKNLTPSQFADKIGVQRSSVSHVLSGRNNPSLDFISKILSAFDELSYEWMLAGKGEMFKSVANKEINLFSEIINGNDKERNKIESKIEDELENTQNVDEESLQAEKFLKKTDHQDKNEIKKSNSIRSNKVENEEIRNVDRIIILYDDKTFEFYSPPKGALNSF